MNELHSIIVRIENISSNNLIKEFLSLLYIIYIFLILLIVSTPIINESIPIINESIEVIIRAISTEKVTLLKEFKNIFNVFIAKIFDFEIVIFIGKILIPIFITNIYLRNIQIKSVIKETLFLLLNITLIICLFHDDISFIFVLFIIFLLFLIRFSISYKKLFYFYFIKNFYYIIILIFEAKDNSHNKNVIMIGLHVILILISCFTLSSLTSFIIPSKLGLLIYMSLGMSVYIKSTTIDKLRYIFYRIVIYFIFIIILATINTEIENSYIEKLGLIVTFYLAWDRLISIYQDIYELITKKSILFYLEEKNITNNILEKTYIDINLINDSFEERDILIQILVRYRLFLRKDKINLNKKELNCQLIKLCELTSSWSNKDYKILSEYIKLKLQKEVNNKKFKKDINNFTNKLLKIDNLNSNLRFYYYYITCDIIYYLFETKQYNKIYDLYNKYLVIYNGYLDKKLNYKIEISKND